MPPSTSTMGNGTLIARAIATSTTLAATIVKGGQDARPTSVKELGISAADWAKLNPLMQQELLNAAQQSGPPEYQEMIKNYYTRIARIESGDDDREGPSGCRPVRGRVRARG